MFNLFGSGKKLAPSSTKDALSEINQAKAMTKVRDEKRFQVADQLFVEGLELIDQYKLSDYDSDLLIMASEKLEESLQNNRNKGETYFWLAYILYNFNELKTALSFLKKAEILTPNYPQIKQLKDIMANT